MPDITFYAGATANMNSRQVELSQNGHNLVHRSRSFKDYFKLTDDTKNANARVGYDFRQALVQRYGDQIGDCVFNRCIGKPGQPHPKPISSRDIRNAIQMANDAVTLQNNLKREFGEMQGKALFDKHIAGKGKDVSTRTGDRLVARNERPAPVPGQNGRLGNATDTLNRVFNAVNQSEPFRQPNQPTGAVMGERTFQLLEKARHLASHPPSPLEGPANFTNAVNQWVNDRDALLNDLRAMHNQANAFQSAHPTQEARDLENLHAHEAALALGELIGQLENEMNAFGEQLTGMRDRLVPQIAGRPMTQKAVDHFALQWNKAALALVTRNAPQGFVAPNNNNNPVAQLNARLNRLSLSATGQGPGRVLQAGEFSQQLESVEREALAALKDCYRQMGIPVPKDKVLKKDLKAAWVGVINDQQWNPITKEIPVKYGDRQFVATSEITPVGAMTVDGDPQGPRLFPGYNGKGFGCADFSTSHSTNLAKTSFTIPPPPNQPNQPPKTFVALRHGIHSALDVPANQRAAANKSRAMECVVAATSLRQQLNPNEPQPIKVRMTSISLVSPDNPRRLPFLGKHGNEHKMLNEQMAAWQAVLADCHGNPPTMTVQVNGQNVEVELEISTFNYGVNAGAMHWYGSPLGIWTGSENINGAPTGRDAFTARVDAYLLENPNDQVVRTLKTQIDQLWDSKDFKGQGGEPYKLTARLAVITQLMGDIPLWNCKSGKDRTGQLDVEAKFLFAKIALTGQVPAPGAPLTDEDKLLLRSIAVDGGNLEMQTLNTGMGGFKLGNVADNYKRMDDDLSKEIHKGGSHFVKA